MHLFNGKRPFLAMIFRRFFSISLKFGYFHVEIQKLISNLECDIIYSWRFCTLSLKIFKTVNSLIDLMPENNKPHALL